MGIPILKFPYLVLREILAEMEPGDVITLSFCSKVAYDVVTSCRPASFANLQLHVIDGDGVQLASETTALCWAIRVTKLDDVLLRRRAPVLRGPRKFITFPRAHLGRGWKTFWEDTKEGMREVIDYVAELFHIEVYGLEFSRPSRWLVEWLTKRQKTIDVVESIEKCDLNWLMENCNARRLELKAGVSGWKQPFNDPFAEIRHSVRIDYGVFDVHELMALNYEHVRFWQACFFGEKDANLLLNQWLAGRLSRVRCMSFEVDFEEEDDAIYNGLGDYMVVLNEERRCHGHSIRVQRGVRRADGAIATLHIDGRYGFFSVV